MSTGIFMQDLPFSMQDFGNIRNFHCLYVDKTQYVYDLIQQKQSFFLSRPRRFGKSVFLSTLKEALLGKKELFKGLWIEKSDYDWQIFGVIHLDFSLIDSMNTETLRTSICCNLSAIAKEYHLDIEISSSSPKDALLVLVKALYAKFGRVAVLIDEYDHAILSNLHTPERASILGTLQSFFAAIKGLGGAIHFLFITGVSTFAKAGIFSGMSHPDDLSNRPQYACLCGYTEEEIATYFSPYLEKMAVHMNKSPSLLKEDFKKLYNGYHFAADSPAVYNPFSLIKALHTESLGNFWFDSGLPSFLIEILKKEYAKKNTRIFQMEEFQISEMEPKYFDAEAISLPALMFQTGYLTIKDFTEGIYTLGFPNLEVRASLQRHMMNILLNVDVAKCALFSNELAIALLHENIDQILSILKNIYSHIPSKLHIPKEKFYHALLIATFQSSGIKTLAEHSTADGSIDLVLELADLIYVIEIKLNKPAKSALRQIEQKEYYRPFLQSADSRLKRIKKSKKK